MKHLATLFLVAAVSACAVPATKTVHLLSRANFDPSKRDETWSRALAAFQEEDLLLASFDRDAGVLISVSQHEEFDCGRAVCNATGVRQLTLCPDGVAMLRVNRGVSGFVFDYTKPLLSPSEVATLQREQDEFLARIVGASAR
jgi:hypothetical protein